MPHHELVHSSISAARAAREVLAGEMSSLPAPMQARTSEVI